MRRRIDIPESLIGQLENIKGFEDSSDEVLAVVLHAVNNDFTAGFLTAVIELYAHKVSGDELIDAVIQTLTSLIENHK